MQMQDYIVHSQGLEQYGSQTDWYKFKLGNSYRVSARNASNAMAYVVEYLGKINNSEWMEYPTGVESREDWETYVSDLDPKHADFERKSLIKL